ncbi:MAG TPA: caspase family protein, partial [Acetobacteraceae bacterium]|nr:caspase family protein [Acetobacteraceae bacterium]
QEGELYAVALSPDGTRAYAGGYTARSWDGSFTIYFFETATGRLYARLTGLPAPIQHLAVSADGRRLAAAFVAQGIRVWDTQNGRVLFEDAEYGAAARMLAFNGDGLLASTSADGRVRVYDTQGRKIADRAPVAGARPGGLAFSPNGSLIAVGFEDQMRVEVLSATDLRQVFVPDLGGLSSGAGVRGGLPAVTWASDARGGVQLYAAGYAQVPPPSVPTVGGTRGQPTGSQRGPAVPSTGGRGVALPSGQQPAAPAAVVPPAPSGAAGREYIVRRWADFGHGPASDIPAARDAISHLVPLPSGGLVYAAADPGWGRLEPDGRVVPPSPPGADFRNTAAGLTVSQDGTQVRFSLRPGGPAYLFDALAGRLGETGPAPAVFVAPRASTARLTLSNWRDNTAPRLGQRVLPLDGEYSRSATILPRENGFVLGTDSRLRLFDAAGRQLAALPTPSAVWGVVATEELLVAVLGDGTIRWYSYAGPQGLTEVASLFVHAETLRWAMWTPEGLFDHAPNGGQELVGVHLNGTRAEAATWATFQQAYRALYAPAAVRGRVAGNNAPAQERLRELGEVRSRIGQLPTLRPGQVCAVTSAGCEPLRWDARALPEGATALRLSFVATDRGLGLGPLDVLVNDRIAARAEPSVGEASVEVPLDGGSNRIATRLYAADRVLFAEGPALDLRGSGPERPPEAGRLVVLAIAVNEYANASLNLRFAVPDAETIAEMFRAQGGALFSEVRVTLLRNAQATRQGILDALNQAASMVQPNDTFVLYIAGHGIRTEPDNRFLFLPHNVRDTSNWTSLRREGLDDSTLVAALARIRARDGFLLLDTCHAGQLTMDQLSALGNETGRFLLAASTSVQEALDSYDDRNGVFVYAVREGLRGRAAVDGEGRVSALALGEWVTRRVPQLAREKNHRQDAVFRTAQRELRSFPLAQVQR